MNDNNFTIYANGSKAKFFNIGVPLLCLLFGSLAVAAFVTNNIIFGIILAAVVIFLIICIPEFMKRKKVTFFDDHLEIPLEYVALGVPFSKTFIRYDGLKSVEYVDKDEAEDDCVGSNGNKVSYIKFIDKEGDVYRLKLEFFSDSQARIIIEETMRRSGMTGEEDSENEKYQ